MTGFELGLLIPFVLLAAFVAGVAWGHVTERRAWVSRALPKNSTPHYCDGEFYYVVPEKVFVNEYTRKKLRPPQGGSGTAPAGKSEGGAAT